MKSEGDMGAFVVAILSFLGSIQPQPHVHHSHKINVKKSVTEVSFDKLSWPLVSFAAVLSVFMQCCNFGALHGNTKNGRTGD